VGADQIPEHDFVAEYESWPARSSATRAPGPEDEQLLRALARAAKATGLPIAGALTAAGVAAILLAELRRAGFDVTQAACVTYPATTSVTFELVADGPPTVTNDA
jgi:hypothetical protein